MATIGSLIVKIGANTKELTKGLQKSEKAVKGAGKNLDSLTVEAEELSEELDNVGNKGRRGLGDVEAAANNAEGSIGDMLAEFGGGAIPAILSPLGLLVSGILAIGAAVVGAALEYGDAMRDMQARTGKTGEELEALGDTALKVYGDNFGDSISDAADAVTQVTQVLGENGEALEHSAKMALLFRDTFDIDIPESLRAVRSAVDSFGIDSAQVFDMMAAVIQNVGDPAGDLADTVNEYSIVFARAGFSAEEMFGILQAGVREGARNFDVVADAVKEFTIRIIDGSETTEQALNDLFAAIGRGEELLDLQRQVDEVSLALEENEAALESAEGAYKAQKSVVNDLERALGEARRELDELSRPKLQGMEELDDKLFETEQRAKRAQLALLDLEPETKPYEDTQELLDQINKEIDKLRLIRDLKYDEQFRELEKAVRPATEEAVTFGQAMDNIARKKEEIAGIEASLGVETGTLAELEGNFNAITQENEQLKQVLEELEAQLGGMETPARELLTGLADGTITGRDAMSEVIQMLKQVDDQVLQNKIGVALFGTKWEDLGPQVILALDPAIARLDNFEGAADAAAEAVGGGLGNAAEGLKRSFLVELMQRLGEEFAPMLERLNAAFVRIAEALGFTGENMDLVSVAVDALMLLLTPLIGLIEFNVTLFEKWSAAIETLVNWIKEAGISFEGWGDGLKGLADKIPDWLKPGSPPPLAFALRDIKAGLQALPSMDDAFGFNAGSPSALAGVGGGGNSSITVNVGGVSATTTGNGDPVNEAIKLVVEMLNHELRRGE